MMTDADVCAEDFDQLLSSLCDTGLEPRQMARLNGSCGRTGICAVRYLLYMGVHATLHYLFGGEFQPQPGAVSDVRPVHVPSQEQGVMVDCERRIWYRRVCFPRPDRLRRFSFWPWSSASTNGLGPAAPRQRVFEARPDRRRDFERSRSAFR